MTDSSHCGSRGLVAMAAVHAHFPQGQPLTLCVCGQGSVHPSNCRIFTALDDCMSSSITLSWLPLASVTLKISLFVFLSFFFFMPKVKICCDLYKLFVFEPNCPLTWDSFERANQKCSQSWEEAISHNQQVSARYFSLCSRL